MLLWLQLQIKFSFYLNFMKFQRRSELPLSFWSRHHY